MYIQPEREPREPLSIPSNYSGNAFRQAPREQALPKVPPVTENVSEPMPPPPPPPLPPDEAVEASAQVDCAEKPRGLRERFPLLSSLLPPARSEHKRGGVLPEWALIGAVILLFLWEDTENDILPFLLLLLLWD